MSSFRARTPEDLLALAPILLGFTPHESVVLMTFEPKGGAHLRFDIGEVAHTLPEYVGTPLIGTRVAVITYTADLERAATVTAITLGMLQDVNVIAVLHADGTTWRPWMTGRFPDDGAVYDTRTHPFTLQAHFDGRTIHPSRESLAETLIADTTAAEAELDTAYTHLERLLSGGDPRWVEAHSVWVQDRLNTWARTGAQPPPADLALLAVTMQFTEIRDAAFGVLDPHDPTHHLETTLRIAAHTPESLSAPARCLAAWAALLNGNGALARIQLDLARQAHPSYEMIEEIEERLNAGTSPATLRHEGPIC